MTSTEYKLVILKNILYQNKILLKKYEMLINNDIKINNLYKQIYCLFEIINVIYKNIYMNNILLFCILILQLFILFK